MQPLPSLPLIKKFSVLLACCLAMPTTQANAAEFTITETVILRVIVEEQRQQLERVMERLEWVEARLAELESEQPQPLATSERPAASPKPVFLGRPEAAVELSPAVRAKYPMTLYGFVKVDAAYDRHATSPGEFSYSVSPRTSDRREDRFHLTARQSRIGIRLDPLEWNSWQVRGVVETDFYGTGSALRLRLAHVSIENKSWRILAGQNWDTWTVVFPNTVNFALMGRQGMLWSRRPLVQLTRMVPVSEFNRYDVSLSLAEHSNADSPVIQGSTAYHTRFASGPAQFSLGGQFGHSNGIETSMAQLSYSIPLTTTLRFSGAIWHGRNLASINGTVGQSINTMTGKEIQSTGGWTQMTLKAANTTSLNLFAGIDNPRDKTLNPGVSGQNISLNYSFGGNVFWDATAFLTLAFEYQFLRTDFLQFSGNAYHSDAHRLQSAVILKF